MIVKINGFIASIIVLQSALQKQLSITSFIHISAAAVILRVQLIISVNLIISVLLKNL